MKLILFTAFASFFLIASATMECLRDEISKDPFYCLREAAEQIALRAYGDVNGMCTNLAAGNLLPIVPGQGKIALSAAVTQFACSVAFKKELVRTFCDASLEVRNIMVPGTGEDSCLLGTSAAQLACDAISQNCEDDD